MDLDGDESQLLPDLLAKLLYALTYNRQIKYVLPSISPLIAWTRRACPRLAHGHYELTSDADVSTASPAATTRCRTFASNT